MHGPMPLSGSGRRRRTGFHHALHPGARGPALRPSWSKPISTRGAIEAMLEGALRSPTPWASPPPASLGHPHHAHDAPQRRCAGDRRVIRDKAGVLAASLTWCAGVAAPASVNGPPSLTGRADRLRRLRIFPETSSCATTTAVVIPQNLVNWSRRRGGRRAHETYIVSGSRSGRKAPGFYPMNGRPRRATRRGRRAARSADCDAGL
jgi:hypothetical protein